MGIESYTLTLKPLSAFATTPLGDTLFGQLCWAIRARYGEQKLNACLAGYTEGRPFLVVSDALPKGFLPRPCVPSWFFQGTNDPSQRKLTKKKQWMPADQAHHSLPEWQDLCQAAEAILPAQQRLASEPLSSQRWQQASLQPHNTINRLSGTTGENEFAPYSSALSWYGQGALLECHLCLDPSRLSAEELYQCFEDIGHFGFGKDASIGAGKFILPETLQPRQLNSHNAANACLSLAPCAPQGLGYQESLSFYQPFTRFGRHGDMGVHHGKPFKNPIVLAQTGGVFFTNPQAQAFIGQGLGGTRHSLSLAIKGTVHQGYAPIVPLHIPEALSQQITQLAEAQ